ncbi:MAG: hypothetical protein PHS83_02790 [Clostridia bacterium]|nr:hypothetical protein [Clostridia bacterium]
MGEFSTKGEANPDLIPAYQMAGELGLPMELAPVTGDFAGEGVLSLLKSGFRGLGGGLKRTLGDKKRLGIVIALVLVWLVVNLLAALGIFPLPVRMLSWLTAARGSLIGGSIGKGLVAALLTQIIVDKGMLQSLKGGLGQLTAAVKGGRKTAVSLLLGTGAGLIACNLLVSSNLQNTMVCVAGFVLSAQALTQNGFLRRLTKSLLPKAKNTAVKVVMGGWALGFALFAAVSLLPGGSNGYILGVLLVIAGGGLIIAGRNKKEVAAQ